MGVKSSSIISNLVKLRKAKNTPNLAIRIDLLLNISYYFAGKLKF